MSAEAVCRPPLENAFATFLGARAFRDEARACRRLCRRRRYVMAIVRGRSRAIGCGVAGRRAGREFSCAPPARVQILRHCSSSRSSAPFKVTCCVRSI
jgi:hypothetical protein